MKKNQIKTAILVLLIAGNIILFFGFGNKYELSYDPERFSPEANAPLVSFKIGSNQGEVILKNEEDAWTLNSIYKADQQLVALFQRIVNSVTVRRPVTLEEGTAKVKVALNTEDEVIEFEVWGNATKTKTFFSDESGVYEMEIPGYRDYLGAIFELKPNQWRDREIFNGNWRTIQKLSVQSNEPVKIAFSNDFYLVEGINEIDSSKVVAYLNLYEHFQVNEIVSEEQIPSLKSILESEPLAKLVIESIDYSSPKEMTIYSRVENQPYHVIKTESDLTAVVDADRISELLVAPSYFRFKPKTK
jgi:ribosomal protein S13